MGRPEDVRLARSIDTTSRAICFSTVSCNAGCIPNGPSSIADQINADLDLTYRGLRSAALAHSIAAVCCAADRNWPGLIRQKVRKRSRTRSTSGICERVTPGKGASESEKFFPWPT